jgi:hypothetical protein
MRTWPLFLFAVCFLATACSTSAGTGGNPYPSAPQSPSGEPPFPGASPGSEVYERDIAATMSDWLRLFKQKQALQFAETTRYADDVTVDGTIVPLPKEDYTTKYWVHPTGRNYWVKVRHPDGRQTCYLEVGMDAEGEPVQNNGVIRCERQ